jgi:hypothetical protein
LEREHAHEDSTEDIRPHAGTVFWMLHRRHIRPYGWQNDGRDLRR